MRFIPFLLVLSTKNAHKFCTHFGCLQSLLHTCPPSCLICFFFSRFWRVTTHDRILWLHFSSHVPSKNALETSPTSSFLLLECKLAPFGCCARTPLMLFFVCVFYSNLRAVQSVTICLHVCLVFALLVCLFFDSTNSERCFAILRANTNYNFLIYGNDFTQIQEIRSHCRRRLF